MRISVAIMAHPKRADRANWLFAKLYGMHVFSDVDIIWDERNSEWDTGSRAMRYGAGRGDWHLVIQDDAVIADYYSLYDNLVSIITAVPTKTIISLYTGKVRPLQDLVVPALAKAPDGSFLNHYMLMWGVALLIPSNHIEAMLEFVSDPIYDDTVYDIRVGMFYQRNRLPIYYSVPSLFDHNDEIGSLIGNGYAKEPRVAHRLAKGLVSWGHKVIDL